MSLSRSMRSSRRKVALRAQILFSCKNEFGVLEGENLEIKGQLAADFSAIMSLRQSVASLEKQYTTLQRKLGDSDEEKEVSHVSLIASLFLYVLVMLWVKNSNPVVEVSKCWY